MISNHLEAHYGAIYHVRLISIGIMLYVIAGNLSNDIYLPCMPHLKTIFGISTEAILLSLTAWFLGDSLPQLFMGPLCDRLGLNRFLKMSAILFLAGTSLCLLKSSYLIFLFGRGLQGVGVCAITILSFASIQACFEGKERIRLLSILGICHTTAPLIGPLLGAYLFSWFGWQSTFALVLVIGIIGISLLSPTLPKKTHVVALDLNTLIKDYFSFIKSGALLFPLLTYGLLFGAMIVFLTVGPLLFDELFQLGPKSFGISQLFVFGAFILGSFINIRYADICSYKIMRISVILLIISCVLLVFFPILNANSPYSILIPLSGLSLAFGLESGRITHIIMSFSESKNGLLSSLIGLSMTGFGCISSFLCSMTFNGSLQSVNLQIAGFCFVACITQMIYLHQHT